MSERDWNLEEVAADLQKTLRGNVGRNVPDEQVAFGNVWFGFFKFTDRDHPRPAMACDAMPTDPVDFTMISSSDPRGDLSHVLLLTRTLMLPKPKSWLCIEYRRHFHRRNLSESFLWKGLLPPDDGKRARRLFT
jgi:hypothetical protein